MNEKVIHLEDGSTIEAKINFATMYYIEKRGVDKLIEKQDALKKEGKELPSDEQMDILAEMLYVILLSNGRKVTFEDALVLMPFDDYEFEQVLNDFADKIKAYEKKRKARMEFRAMQQESK
jgi:hypothetical protein